MAIQLVTFGGLHAADDTIGEGEELERLFAQHSRAALFVYMAVERRVSRESLTALFWPESDAENARHALRQSLYQLRKSIGSEWIESRAHELEVVGDIRTDVQAFTDAIDRGDAASAVRLYKGPFLDGVHLVDLKPWESWVDGKRAHFARAFRKACRDLIEARRAAGDLTGAVAAAEQWAARDPTDDEAQHRLIEALAAAGERAEAIRQYETYARALEPEGLQPLEETRALAERLRAESGPLPALRAVEPAPTPAPPNELAVGAPGAARKLRWPIAAAAAIVLVGGVWALRQRRAEPAASASAATIAVLPFRVRGDPAVQYLGDGIVNLLGAALDGAGTLRPVDTRAIFATVDTFVTPDLERAQQVAARLGAAMFVLGDVVEAGGRIQIEGVAYRAGAAEPSAKAVVNGSADSVFALVDQLAARLLGELGDPAADRLTRTASLTTRSLGAFKSYLQGEGFMRAGQFEQAADAYLTAIVQDSTFALAHYRLGLARQWAPLPGELDAADAAGRHVARLSARDRSLLEAFREWRIGNPIEAARAYRAILARYPDDVDAWFQLGEIQFHHSPLLGRPLSESEEAWRKVLSYEPRNLYAVTHIARLAAVDGRVSALDSLAATFPAEQLRTDRRIWEIVPLRAVARGDTAAAHALAKDVRHWESLSLWRVAAWVTAFTPDPGFTSNLISDMVGENVSPAARADLYWFASVLDLAAGRPGASRSHRAQALESERAAPAEHRRRAFDAVTEWFAATLPSPYAESTLASLRAQVSAATPSGGFRNELGMGTQIQLEPLRQYTLGTIALRLGDAASARDAAAKLQQFASAPTAPVLVRDLDRGLRARVAQKEGRLDEALRLLEGIEASDPQGDVAVIPFVSRANERFLHAEVLASLGRTEEALRWFASVGHGSVTEVPLLAPSHLRQAEINERLGNKEQAATHYKRFLELWRNADGEFEPVVAATRQRLASLTRSN